ncbi:MAG: hypothetical protein HYS23_06795 [Geobacter sp.]|nr:hypothetical protein [Geobacter sp.]
MTVNPEFRRNIWLEVTPNRLAGMPLVLFAMILLAYVTDDYKFADSVSAMATGLFYIISLIWGTRLASESVMTEIRDHTWDGQRMSAISPWALSWGKLFGSTIYTWYGALICLFVTGASATGKDPGEVLKSLLLLALASLFSQAVSLLASLMAIQKERKYNKSQSTAFLVLGIVAATPFLIATADYKAPLEWFGTRYERLDFILATLFFSTLWALVGIYHLMRVELQLKNRPWVWYGFMFSLMGYMAGFFYAMPFTGTKVPEEASPPLIAAYFMAVAITYFMGFAERKDFLSLRALLGLATAGMWGRFMERSPRWILAIPVPVATGLALMLSALSVAPGASYGSAWFVLASIFFMLRDLGIMLFCNLGKSARRADMLTILYLGLLYGVIPFILKAMGAESTIHFFFPQSKGGAYLGALGSFSELLLIAWLVTIRWKARLAEMGR